MLGLARVVPILYGYMYIDCVRPYACGNEIYEVWFGRVWEYLPAYL